MLRTRKLRSSTEQRRKTAEILISPEGLLAPINRKAPSKHTAELIELLHTLQKIDRWIAVDREVDRLLKQHPQYDSTGPIEPAGGLYVRANEILSKYHWTPIVRSPAEMGFTWNRKTEQSDWENMFVFWIFNLLADGELARLRGCHDCGKWFYAVTSHQVYCKNQCRQHQQTTGRGFKEKRRLYMKEYRRLQKGRYGAKEFRSNGTRHDQG